MSNIIDWTIDGANGEAIIGNAHVPQMRTPRGVVLIVHGFLGYKDYGMFPAIAQLFCRAGFIVHRFNLAHSGMTNNFETFERPDLFEKDTWRNQVTDVNAVIDAVASGELAGAGLPVVLFGHSRGGVTSILTAATRFREGRAPVPTAVITASAPSFTCSLPDEIQEQLLAEGYFEVTSNRTGQVLRVGTEWLADQRRDPDFHNLETCVGVIECPLMLIHGADDPTVPAVSAETLASGGKAGRTIEVVLVHGGDHVFNTPNPFLPDDVPSPQLQHLLNASLRFAEGLCPDPEVDGGE